eukprot:767793-Hanusia_phi.AAC.4
MHAAVAQVTELQFTDRELAPAAARLRGTDHSTEAGLTGQRRRSDRTLAAAARNVPYRTVRRSDSATGVDPIAGRIGPCPGPSTVRVRSEIRADRTANCAGRIGRFVSDRARGTS